MACEQRDIRPEYDAPAFEQGQQRERPQHDDDAGLEQDAQDLLASCDREAIGGLGPGTSGLAHRGASEPVAQLGAAGYAAIFACPELLEKDLLGAGSRPLRSN